MITFRRFLALSGLVLVVLLQRTDCGTWAAAVAIEEKSSGCGGENGTRPLCCVGKNNTCVAKGPRTRAPTAKTCFCDSNCATFGDCCVDYSQVCPVLDCQPEDDWSEWTECDAACGRGLKRRHRKVLAEARNGGRPCTISDTEQTASCRGTNCKVARASKGAIEFRETGRIVPASFATWRHNKLYDPFKDIRRNLYEHYGDSNAISRPAYCARYRITDVHSTCRKMSTSAPGRWPERLVRGAQLCVECQPSAMQKSLGSRCRGHGVLHRRTPWKAVAVPGCHGKWRLVTPFSTNCDCGADDPLSFVLV